MANTFYYNACKADAKITPILDRDPSVEIIDQDADFNFYDADIKLPHSIMNDNVAINYRTIYNGYATSGSADFTPYSDYEKCMAMDKYYTQYLVDRKNPTYRNIMTYYNSEDEHGLASYKMQDFIYLKYYNQIPNNYMLTLRRYTRPCEDHMFGLDMPASGAAALNGYSNNYFAIATAVTYMGEKAGNKLSDILKFDYGANWEDKEGKVESIKNPDGGLAAQLRLKDKVSNDFANGVAVFGGNSSITAQARGAFLFAAACKAKGVDVNSAISSQHQYEGNTFNARYGEEFYGDVNVVNKVKLRSRGLTFSNNFSLVFEYSLKSLKCVNPRIAMMDILSNFLLLTGNYGEFWGGATIFYGQKNIAPQFGDPDKLRNGEYGAYVQSLVGDVKEGFKKISQMDKIEDPSDFWQGLINSAKNVGSGFIQGMIGNLLGGNIGVAGEAQVPQALLSGQPSGFWHLTVGNPLDPIAMMGNLAVTKTSVQFSDALGYDDFPTEIKFTVDLEHCRPRDNAQIEAMFNAGKGRFYSFTNNNLLEAYHTIDSMQNFKQDDNMTSQEKNTDFSTKTGTVYKSISTHTVEGNEFERLIGGNLNG